MKCTTSEVDIEVVINRIVNYEINLQPDFQRGEVWTTQKKRRLIDSILRGWKIPPIHVIENAIFIDEVLDGQQRLTAIRDFYLGKITVDGNILPYDDTIKKLDGQKYSELDLETQRKFKKYNMTFIRLTEYRPDEPAELFNRLNQPNTLTSAEKRNAYSGKTRNQIRDLVQYFISKGAEKNILGFSNSRMAYDEVLLKYCYSLEKNTLHKKVTSNELTDLYRNDYVFDYSIIEIAHGSIELLMDALYSISNPQLNKATLFSWLIFIARNHRTLNKDVLGDLLLSFETSRQLYKGSIAPNSEEFYSSKFKDDYPFWDSMLLLFNQKASLSIFDVSSVITRDIILELYYIIHNSKDNNILEWFLDMYNSTQNFSYCIEMFEILNDWGDKII